VSSFGLNYCNLVTIVRCYIRTEFNVGLGLPPVRFNRY